MTPRGKTEEEKRKRGRTSRSRGGKGLLRLLAKKNGLRPEEGGPGKCVRLLTKEEKGTTLERERASYLKRGKSISYKKLVYLKEKPIIPERKITNKESKKKKIL